MDNQKVMYAITIEDITEVSEDRKINFTEDDLAFIQDKIGDYMGSIWYEAVDFALTELKALNKSNKKKTKKQC